MTTPTPDQQWKLGDEFLPFHPQASHVLPDYRDGWNACYKAATARAEPTAWVGPGPWGAVIHHGYYSSAREQYPEKVAGYQPLFRSPFAGSAQASSKPPALGEADLCEIFGKRPDGSQELLGKGPMPPAMKARELLRDYGFDTPDDEDSESAFALAVCEDLVAWMLKVGWQAPPAVAVPARRMRAIKTVPDLMAEGSEWVEIRPNVFRPAAHPEGYTGLDFNDLARCGYRLENYLVPVEASQKDRRQQRMDAEDRESIRLRMMRREGERNAMGKAPCGHCGSVCEPCSDFCASERR